MAEQIITGAELGERLRGHESWVDSYGRDPAAAVGTQLILKGAVLADMRVIDRDMTSARLFDCRLTNMAFERCDLSGAEFLNTVFKNCTFVNCRFVKADLRGCDCRGVRFLECDLTRADLTDADLGGADLTGSILDWAWLVNTDLRHATLEGVRLVGARLGGTKLYNNRRFRLASTEGAVVKGVDFSPGADGSKIVGAEALSLIQM
jgi:uncharacterized protein YjbI with pentapeptide repeats